MLNLPSTSDASNMNPIASTSTQNGQENSDEDEEFDNTHDDIVATVESELTNDAQNTDADNSVLENVATNDETTVDANEQSDNGLECNVNADDTSNSNIDSEIASNRSQSNGDNDDDSKYALAQVNMDPDDEIAIVSLFDGQENAAEDIDNNASSSTASIGVSLRDDETFQIGKDGKIMITRNVDDDLKMIYTHGETVKPLPRLYEIKINDTISGNIPFKNNATNDRAYLVKIGNEFKEIKMASLLVKGLGSLNDSAYRKQPGLDLAFVKALIIGLCTKKAIKNGENIHKDLLVFMKGLNIFVDSIL